MYMPYSYLLVDSVQMSDNACGFHYWPHALIGAAER